MAATLFTSCSDFLNVTPKDKVLEPDQFKTEDGINTALNGLYRQLVDKDLYGGNLSQTTLEAMGHYYTYSSTKPASADLETDIWFLANGNYTDYESVTNLFANVWKTGYKTLFNINNFLKGVEESKAIIDANSKNNIMGEAYGLRAYLHFDLFRLFGPRYEERSATDKILPYNNTSDPVLNHTGYEDDVYSTADTYLQLLQDDIRKAEDLLSTDPILSQPMAITDTLQNNYYLNRNRRMNYYAVKGLEARVLQYMGRLPEAATVAKEVTDQLGSSNDKKKAFRWIDPTSVNSKRNYTFFREVVFGIETMEMSSNYSSYYEQSDLRKGYAVDLNNLTQNIFPEQNFEASTDVRTKQWVLGEASSNTATYSPAGTYISKKFKATSSDLPAIKNLQPLLRMSEMFYIQAEAALAAGDKDKAIEILSSIAEHRGLSPQYYPTKDSDFAAYIEREYYKEFYGEGQIYFFHKRRGDAKMYKGNNVGTEDVNTAKAYTVAIPKDETDI
jgi:hypothetical protein